MTAGTERPLREDVADMAERLYAPFFTDDALRAAAQPENVGVEIVLLRQLVVDVLRDKDKRNDIAPKLLDQIVKAVAVRYRLSPRSTDSLASALKGIFDGLAAIDAERDEEEV